MGFEFAARQCMDLRGGTADDFEHDRMAAGIDFAAEIVAANTAVGHVREFGPPAR